MNYIILYYDFDFDTYEDEQHVEGPATCKKERSWMRRSQVGLPFSFHGVLGSVTAHITTAVRSCISRFHLRTSAPRSFSACSAFDTFRAESGFLQMGEPSNSQITTGWTFCVPKVLKKCWSQKKLETPAAYLENPHMFSFSYNNKPHWPCLKRHETHINFINFRMNP